MDADDTVLLVDLAGVLFAFDHERRLEQLSQCLGMPAAEVDAVFWQSGFSNDCDAGRYASAADVRAEVRHISGYEGTDDDLDKAWCSAFTPDGDVLGLLEAVQDRVHLALFTNNGPLEEEALLRLEPRAFAPFADLFFCHRLSANKPDPAAYDEVSELLGVPAERLLFVDDGEDNVEAARERGWTAVRYRSLEDLAALVG